LYFCTFALLHFCAFVVLYFCTFAPAIFTLRLFKVQKCKSLFNESAKVRGNLFNKSAKVQKCERVSSTKVQKQKCVERHIGVLLHFC
jgi:hypothetical protein